MAGRVASASLEDRVPRQIEYRGKVHSFPDNFTDEEIQEALKSLDPPVRSQHWTIIGLVAAIVVVLVAGFVVLKRKDDGTMVIFHGVPAGATLQVNDTVASDTMREFAPGKYRWSVSAEGFETASGEFEAKGRQHAVNVELHALAPPPPPDTVATDTLPVASPFGRILVLTPTEDSVAVSVNGKAYGATRRGELLIDTLNPGAYTIAVKKDKFCVMTTQPRGAINVVADSQREVKFTLKAWPRLVINADPVNARFRLKGDTTTRFAGQEYPLAPGSYTYTVSAAQHRDTTADVALTCGQTAKRVEHRLASMVVARDTEPAPAAKPAPAETGWAADCFRVQEGWQKAAKDCFYGSTLAKYEFEVRRSGGGYGTWFIGAAGGKVEFELQGDKWRWRNLQNKWQEWQKLEIPKDNKSLFVRVASDGAGATVLISTEASFAQPIQMRLPEGPAGFGVKKNFQLRDLRRH
jgi:hypothetical protein